MDMSRYRELFLSEARGHLETCSALVVHLEQPHQQDAPQVVNELFRHIHSLKGMAATMGYGAISELAHNLEDLLGLVREGQVPSTPALADLLLEGCDTLAAMLSRIEGGSEAHPEQAGDLIGRLVGFPSGAAAPTGQTSQTSQTGPISPDEPRHQFRHSDSFQSIRIKTELLDHLVNITGELITTRHSLDGVLLHHPLPPLREPLGRLSLLLRELRDAVFQARTIPFASVAERLPRLARDLARRHNKEVELQIRGSDIELDRSILEKIAEPLVHILRNAVDHGVETPGERTAAGKPPCGTVTVSVDRSRDHVTIVVADDGHGMDPARLVQTALEKGVLSAEQAATLSPQEALQLVCTPGFSTAGQVSDISGRGVGMDAVKNAVHSLGGTLTIDSQPGQGCRFIMKLPATVSIIQALLVSCGSQLLALPVSAVDRTLEIDENNDLQARQGQALLTQGDITLPLVSLNRLLGQPVPRRGGTLQPVIIAAGASSPIGLTCDRILGQQEIFVKPLGQPLASLPGLIGGAILGDGRIVFVMDVTSFG